MNKRAAGVAFCGIAAFLFIMRYLVAALFEIPSSIGTLFPLKEEIASPTPVVLSILSLLIGIGYLVWAEIAKEK